MGVGSGISSWVMCLSSSIRVAWASSHGSQRVLRAKRQGNSQILLASNWPKQITWPCPETVWQGIPQREWIKGSVSIRGCYCRQYVTPLLSVSSGSLQHFLMGTKANKNTCYFPLFLRKAQFTKRTAQNFFFHLTYLSSI